jgi:hypothetical protein
MTAKARGSAPDPQVRRADEEETLDEYYRRMRREYVTQLEGEIATIEASVAGVQATLASKREELVVARAAVAADEEEGE